MALWAGDNMMDFFSVRGIISPFRVIVIFYHSAYLKGYYSAMPAFLIIKNTASHKVIKGYVLK